jgi:hypothetical protein
MLAFATREEWVWAVLGRGGGGGSRPARDGVMSISPLVETQDGMIGSAIELEKRSLDPVGEFDELIQDGFGVRGSMPLIGKGTTKVPNCLRACRLGLFHKVRDEKCPQQK